MPELPGSSSPLPDLLQTAFQGVAAVAAGIAAIGALLALRHFKRSADEAQAANKRADAERHSRVRPIVNFTQGRSMDYAVVGSLEIAGPCPIYDVALRLAVTPTHKATCDPEYFSELLPQKPEALTLTWDECETALSGRLILEFRDALGRSVRWSRPIGLFKHQARLAGLPEIEDLSPAEDN